VSELLTRMIAKHPTTVAVAALDVAPGLEAPGPLVSALESLVREPATPTASLTSVADALPHSSLLWANTAAELLSTLVTRSRPEAPDESAIQDRGPLDIFGSDRIQFANETTGIIDKAAEAQGLRIDWSRSDLASNLDDLAGRLAAVGRMQEALATSTRAVQMYRQLAHGRDPHP
jgi:hypothetical protein